MRCAGNRVAAPVLTAVLLAAPPVLDARLRALWDAGDEPLGTSLGGDGQWAPLRGSANDNFAPGGATAPEVVAISSAFAGTTRALRFDGTDRLEIKSFSGTNVIAPRVDTGDTRLAIALQPGSLTGGRQVVFETGGDENGLSLVLIDSALTLTAGQSAATAIVLQAGVDLAAVFDPADFLQVVACIEFFPAGAGGAVAEIRLEVTNAAGASVVAADATTDPNFTDWCGVGVSGLGRNRFAIGGDLGGAVTDLGGGGGFSTFQGLIASFRLDDSCVPDTDGDGVPDATDTDPLGFNPESQRDTDGDGLGDLSDPDDDNDGIPDTVDNCPLVANPAQDDLDGDGTGDACDDDLDGDGVANAGDNSPRTPNPGQADGDGDGIGDASDPDADGDGVADVLERALYRRADRGDALTDSDRDGVPDVAEAIFGTDPTTAGPALPTALETRGSEEICLTVPTLPNRLYSLLRADADDLAAGFVTVIADVPGDGALLDLVDGRPFSKVIYRVVARLAPGANNIDPRFLGTALGDFDPGDTDGDGTPDAFDADRDNDGVPDAADNLPGTFNPDQVDADGDDIGDLRDNAPGVFNPYQEDTDNDGVGDRGAVVVYLRRARAHVDAALALAGDLTPRLSGDLASLRAAVEAALTAYADGRACDAQAPLETLAPSLATVLLGADNAALGGAVAAAPAEALIAALHGARHAAAAAAAANAAEVARTRYVGAGDDPCGRPRLATLAAALDAAPADGTPGPIVFLPPGTHAAAAANLTTAVNLRGEGGGVTELTWPDEGPLEVDLAPGTGVLELRGLTLRGGLTAAGGRALGRELTIGGPCLATGEDAFLAMDGIDFDPSFAPSPTGATGDCFRLALPADLRLYPGAFVVTGGAWLSVRCNRSYTNYLGPVALASGGTLSLRDITVVSPQPLADGSGGWAAYVEQAGTLTLKNGTLQDCHEAGVVAVDSGSELLLRQVAIAGVTAGTNSGVGAGAVVHEQARGWLCASSVGGVDSGADYSALDGCFPRSLDLGTCGLGGAIVAATDARVEGDDLIVEGNTGLALFVSGASLELANSAVSGTAPNASGRLGLGLRVEGGATAIVDAVDFINHHEAAVEATGRGSQLYLTEVNITGVSAGSHSGVGAGVVVHEQARGWLSDTAVSGVDRGADYGAEDGCFPASLDLGRCGIGGGIVAAGGGQLAGDQLDLNGNTGLAALVSGAILLLQDSQVRSTSPNASGRLGLGLRVEDGGSALLDTVTFGDLHEAALEATGSGTYLQLADVTVDGVSPGAASGVGAGVLVHRSAKAKLDRVAIAGVDSGALPGGGENCYRINPLDLGECGVAGALALASGGRVNADQVELSGNLALGIFVSGATLSLADSRVENTFPNGDGHLGMGLWLEDGAAAAVDRTTLEGNYEIGVFAGGAGTALTADTLTVSATQRGALLSLGIGVAAQDGAAVALTDAEVSQTEGAGVAAFDASTVTLSACTISENTFAGLLVAGATLDAAACTVSDTAADAGEGGGFGLFLDQDPAGEAGTSTVALDGCELEGNALAGAFILGNAEGDPALSGTASFRGCVFRRHATTSEGAAEFHGNGLFASSVYAGLSVNACEFRSNQGGQMELELATLSLSGNSYLDGAVDILAYGGYDNCDDAAGTAEIPLADGGTAPLDVSAEPAAWELCPRYDTVNLAETYQNFCLLLDIVDPEGGGE